MRPATTADSTGAPVNVLVVDDVRANRVALEAVLARPDLVVLTASSGTEALELMLVHEIAIAVIDVHMPDMDGFELAELMRSSPRTGQVPIIFITAEPHDQARQFRDYEAGAVDFLNKPVEPRVLRGKLDVFVELFRQQRELTLQIGRLREALAINEKFVAVLGHDLRTPLNAISMAAGLIGEQSTVTIVQKSARRILRSSARMARMIDHLLCFARARSGETLLIRPRPVNLATLVDSTLEDYEREREDRVEVCVEGDVHGTWDSDRLQQVAANLITNALRHGAPEELVTVVLDGRADDHVTLCVFNAGVIPRDRLSSLFEPFRSSSGGLGLGLFIVRCFVEAHGGCVDVHSAQDEGTRFCVRLPRHASPVERLLT
jgi:two-component system, sensor histidine kinase and response regulator